VGNYLFKPMPTACRDAAISPDSRWLVADCGAAQNVWDLSLDEPFKEVAGGSDSTTLFWDSSFSRDGRRLERRHKIFVET
jgi:hypothetical protein